MTAPPISAHTYSDHRHSTAPFDMVHLYYDARFMHRKALHPDDGGPVLVDLLRTTSLGPGYALILASGTEEHGFRPALALARSDQQPANSPPSQVRQ